jgi:hypothetical protein
MADHSRSWSGATVAGGGAGAGACCTSRVTFAGVVEAANRLDASCAPTIPAMSEAVMSPEIAIAVLLVMVASLIGPAARRPIPRA